MKTKLEGESGEGEAKGERAMSLLCCLLLENPALRALPDMFKLRTCACVCVCLDTIDACTHDTTRYKEGLLQGVRLQLWLTERGHATATPTVNRHRGGQQNLGLS